MRPKEKIEKIIKKFDVDVNVRKDQEIFDELRQTQAKSRQSERGISTIIIWRIIMKSKMTKFAVAAMIIIAIGISVTLIEKTTTPAYAIERTIEAYNSIRFLHARESGGNQGEPLEFWIKSDGQGNITRMRFQSDNIGDLGPLIVVGDRNSAQAWLAGKNLKLIVPIDPGILIKQDIKELDPGYLFERLYERQRQGKANVDINEPSEKNEPIVVTITYPPGSISKNWKKVFYVDQATKLITRIDKFEFDDNKFDRVKTTEFFNYNQPIDAMMFTLDGDVPDGATVIDTTDVEAGLARGGMSEEEVANEITRQFFEAMIANDLDRAGKFFMAVPGFFIRQMLENPKVTRIFSVGPSHPDPDPDSDAMISSCKFFADYSGQYYDSDAHTVRVMKLGKNSDRWMISGMAINSYPAGGEITLSPNQNDLTGATYDGLVPKEFMQKWLILDPIQIEAQVRGLPPSHEKHEAIFAQDHIDVTQFAPSITIGENIHTWSLLENDFGIINLIKKFGPQCQIAYAAAQINMPRQKKAVLGIGSDDGARVWLNGELVNDKWELRAVWQDRERVPVTFKAGANYIVIKVQNAAGAWGFCCRLLDE
ncbi:MAG: LolA family protein [Planctomycetota bacterium]|jgi:hypothetical protein